MKFNFNNILKVMNIGNYNSRGSVYTYKVIKEEELKNFIDNNIHIIDVRTKSEFEKMRIKTAVNIPVCDIDFSISTLVINKNDKLLVYCLNGERTKEAIRKLNKLGYNNIYVWQGGGISNLKNGTYIEY